MRAAVLVEGRSDSAALERLAVRRGRDLTAEGVAVVAMGGATNIRRYLERLGPRGLGLELAGLCDAAEVGFYRRGLAAVGFGVDLTRAQMEQHGFFVCVADLEDELIRALGTDAVETVVDERGELGSFRTMQQQPAQRDRPLDAQLRRFLGTRGGRKIAYAPALIDALDLDRVPAPLDGVLGAV